VIAASGRFVVTASRTTPPSASAQLEPAIERIRRMRRGITVIQTATAARKIHRRKKDQDERGETKTRKRTGRIEPWA
jgi:hypothetical protein